MTACWVAGILIVGLATGEINAGSAAGTAAPPRPLGAVAYVRRLPPVDEPVGASALPATETLAQAWAAALAFDQRLAARRSDVSSAQQYLGLARAQRWPWADVESSYRVRSAQPAFSSKFMGIPVAADVFPFAQRENFAMRTGVELPLYTGGRISHGIDAAVADVSGSDLEVEKASLDLRMDVAAEYVAVLHAQRDLQIVESSVSRLESHARDVQLLFEHGRVPRNDRLAAEVALANVRQEAIRAANQLDSVRAAFNRRLGRPLGERVALAELPEAGPAPDLDQLTARAVENRPETAILVSRIRALQYRADAVRGARHPQVSLQGEYAFEENRYRSPEGIAAVGVGVSWNVFDAGRRSYEAAGLLWQAESLRRVQADVASAIGLEVRQAWLDVDQTYRRIAVTRQALTQAEENLRVAANRYRAGLAISTEVLDAESLRTQAYGNHCRATYDAALAALRLQYATGRLGQ